MIEIEHLTKRYGKKTAVNDLTFTVKPGAVTGFLGPNGAGKSTTMRTIMGLDAPTAGIARVNGKHYSDFRAPLTEVGALLEAKSVHSGRSAYKHLLALAHTHGIPKRRVREVLDTVGLTEVAGKRVGGFSLGMGQRLGIAVALLGDPAVLILDEPVNGLDPDGVRWIRELLKGLAAEGRTVFLSSHLMSELAQTAEHLIVIGQGKLLADTTVDAFVNSRGASVRVVSPESAKLAETLQGPGITVTSPESGVLLIEGTEAAVVGEAAAAHGVVLHELRAEHASLEDVFMEITAGTVEYHQSQEGVAAK
ncbi:ABC transporter ATP-binding protein [Glycomyces buryatensis]|uniref:ABC transporter ATP-binding protein n=1 Tax=Glycomyces buryatensis TaxID=2570927 RepID=A0A4V4HQF0_9ACTN|nr:ABC transporter ATP-binding protein [Glycomyces buryatensis]THV33526.1 ABC transporter ATP-binding protein [Glycomyces buryatensis]